MMEALKSQARTSGNPTGLITDNIHIWTSAIKTRSSAGRGSSKKLDLYGIKKLRELILELAVRGKLVPQDPNDEPASVLLERIAAEKAQLIKEKKIKKQRALQNIADDEKTFASPPGWAFTRLNDIIHISSGNGLTSKQMNQEGGIPVYGGNGVTGYHDDFNVSEETLVIGRVGFYCGSIHVTPPKAWVTDNAFVTTFSNKCIFIGYLTWLLKATNLSENDSATAQPVISGRKVYPIVVALPPLAEQHRIVAKVDELMVLCDQLEQQTEASIDAHATLVETLLTTLTNSTDAAELEQNWNRIADHFDTLFTTDHSIDQLKQAVLQLAVMGKLVPQNPNDEPAAVLLEKIAAEKAQLIKEKKIKKQKIQAISADCDLYEISSGWSWTQLGELTVSEDNAMCDGPFGSKLKTEHYISEKGFTVVRLGNIGVGKFLWGKEGHISKEHYELLENNHMKAGDLVVAGMAEPLIRACEVPPSLGPAVNKADCFRLRVHDSLEKKYICLYLNSPVAKLFAGEENRGMTRQRINLGKCKAIPVPIPPITEQHRIVAKVDQLMTLCDQLKERLQQTQQTQLHLADALVEQAVG